MSRRILVCGGREFDDHRFLNKYLDLVHRFYGVGTVIQGGAKGADYLAARWSARWNIVNELYVANWTEEGKAAGYIRNRRMLVEGEPDLVIGFPGGVGTHMMLDLARAMEVHVIEPLYQRMNW